MTRRQMAGAADRFTARIDFEWGSAARAHRSFDKRYSDPAAGTQGVWFGDTFSAGHAKRRKHDVQQPALQSPRQVASACPDLPDRNHLPKSSV